MMNLNNDPIERLLEISDRLPITVLADIKSRMGDWMLSGGKKDDSYMWQQVKFAENWLIFNGGNSNEED
ncbi:DUF6877 family protein [Companilactobacillus nantensis]|nr:DUF6877 family protein [Companilactobacillus nantensis]